VTWVCEACPLVARKYVARAVNAYFWHLRQHPLGELAQAVQAATGQNVEVSYVDQGYTGAEPAAQAEAQGMRLEVVKHHEAKRGFVLLQRRWVVERSFAWAARFRRLARDYERLASTLAGYHWLAFATLMLHSFFN